MNLVYGCFSIINQWKNEDIYYDIACRNNPKYAEKRKNPNIGMVFKDPRYIDLVLVL